MSKTNSFAGVGKVYKFTLGQNLKSKGFKIVTALVAIVFMGIFIAINVIGAWDKSTDVRKVYILDESGMIGYDNEMLSNYDEEAIDGIDKVEFELVGSKGMDAKAGEGADDNKTAIDKDELLNIVCDEEATVGIYVGNDDNKITVTAYVDENGILDEDDAIEIAEYVSGYYDMLKISNAGLSEEQIVILFTPINIIEEQIGSESGMTAAMMKIFAPMIVSLVLYMMLLFYGQTISKSVIAEKDSKLMEYILTSVKSQGLIAGKILAMVTLAVIQMVIWLSSAGVGLFAGEYIGKQINPDYSNVIVGVIKTLKDEAAGAFTWYGSLLAFVTFIIGFLFFCTLAGLVSSFVQKTDGLAQMMVIYQYSVIIGFLVSYMGSLMENKTLIAISNYVPICSPFSLPANIVIGSMGAGEIAISLGILIVSTFVIIVATARVYSALVLFNGAKVTPKVIKSALLGK